MDKQTFEQQYREEISDVLNQLQTLVLVVSQLETRVNGIGDALHSLSQTVEDYLNTEDTEDLGT
ncbi:MAG: hypothetical protein AAF215_15290 [Cyanobacteria bacterium P01_A01_bin.123]